MPWTKIKADCNEPYFYTESNNAGRRITYSEAIREGAINYDEGI